jgi:hypothetical protein
MWQLKTNYIHMKYSSVFIPGPRDARFIIQANFQMLPFHHQKQFPDFPDPS